MGSKQPPNEHESARLCVAAFQKFSAFEFIQPSTAVTHDPSSNVASES